MDKFYEVLKQLKAFWANLPTPKRLALVLVTLTVLIGVLVISVVSSRVSYGYLFTELSPEDASAITQKLKELKVPYQIEAGGSAIQVPEERVHELRLELAGNGLPRGGGVGFEIFDQAHFGATEFEQRVNLRRALEGELSRSIQTIEGVQVARVHLVLPENRLFASKSEGASASVVLKLRKGHEFGKHEVAGIVHLVTAAVPNLSRDRVSVVSTEGMTLHRPDSEGARGASNDDQAISLATQKEAQVRSLLERVVGPGKADVRVHVDLDSSARERTEEHYEPAKTALRSEQKTEETTGVEGATVAGVPGAQTNLPDVEPTAPTQEAATGGNIFRRSQTRNWEVDRVTQKTVTPAGDINRQSIAVLVDGVYETRDGALVYAPRSAEDLTRFEALVKNAVGFDAERGDTIQIEGAQFARLEGDIAEPIVPVWKRYAPQGLSALAAILMTSVLVLVWRQKRKLKLEQAEAQAKALQAGQVPTALGGLLSAEPALGQGAELGQLPAADPEAVLNRRAAALELAANDPATAAIVIKRWLSEAGPVAPREQNASLAQGVQA